MGEGGLSKNVGHQDWLATKSYKKAPAKTPKSSHKKKEIWTKI